MTTDELRAKFEAMCRSKCWPIHRGGEQYDSTPTQHTWEGCLFGYASRDAEVEALKAELSEAKDGWHQANGVADLAMRHRDAAESEVESLKSDAERYQLLRSGKSDIPLPLGAEALDIYLDRRLAAMAKESQS